MLRTRFTTRLLSWLVVASMLLQSLAPAVALAQEPDSGGGTVLLPLIAGGRLSSVATDTVFRTRVTVATTAQWRDLERMDPVFLARGDNWADLLVDDAQMADLARWRYNPESTDTLEALVTANDADGRMAAGFAPLLAAATDLRAALTADKAAASTEADAGARRADQPRASLRAALQALAAQQLDFVLAATSTDTDNDGLNDTLEGYWCTDPTKADSDLDGIQDSAEVAALKGWVANKIVQAPSSGKPFASWPNQTTCLDDDYDSVPDAVEWLELGLRGDTESTDRDQFDDGQELFGATKCPGSGTACGYGSLPPANTAGIVLFPEMPGWVRMPGDHPLVTALPIIEIHVMPSTLHVERVTNITTSKGQISLKEKNYSTSKTEGTSSSVTDTDTWNEWEEVSKTSQSPTRANSAELVYEPNPFSDCDTTLNREVIEACVRTRTQTIEGLKSFAGSSFSLVRDKASQLTGAGWSFITANSQILGDNVTWLGDQLSKVVRLSNCSIGLDLGCDLEFDWSASGFADPNTPLLQDMAHTLAGLQPNVGSGNTVTNLTRNYPIQFPAPPFVPTTTNTKGSSKGGSHAVTHSEYQENTITEGEAFTTGEEWSTAVAENSAHAAD
jgi:hypothetical protein